MFLGLAFLGQIFVQAKSSHNSVFDIPDIVMSVLCPCHGDFGGVHCGIDDTDENIRHDNHHRTNKQQEGKPVIYISIITSQVS